MKHPPYFLRPNKVVDRLMLIEAIKHLDKLYDDPTEYTYYGLGGPYLEDFRLIYDFCPGIKMVSIENNKDTIERQKFHFPCSIIRLKHMSFESFLARYSSNDKKSIFWLDYIDLEYDRFAEFESLLSRVSAGSMVKITLCAKPDNYFEDPEEFSKKFEAIMPDPWINPPRGEERFARLLQDMLRIVTQRALPAAMANIFQPVSSFRYSDGTPMLTLTGIICLRKNRIRTREAFHDWQFANLNWAKPRKIDVPILSTKERLYLQRKLPCRRDAGKKLLKRLGYLIDKDKKKTVAKLKQYATFHRYSPYFVRAIP